MNLESNKILEAHIHYNSPTDCLISIAIQLDGNKFTALSKNCPKISEEEIKEVLKSGDVLSEQKARDLFFLPNYKYISEDASS